MRTSILVSTSNDLSIVQSNPRHQKHKRVYAGVVEHGDELNINVAYHLSKLEIVSDTWAKNAISEHLNTILKEHIRKLKQNPSHPLNLDTMHLQIHVGEVQALN